MIDAEYVLEQHSYNQYRARCKCGTALANRRAFLVHLTSEAYALGSEEGRQGAFDRGYEIGHADGSNS